MTERPPLRQIFQKIAKDYNTTIEKFLTKWFLGGGTFVSLRDWIFVHYHHYYTSKWVLILSKQYLKNIPTDRRTCAARQWTRILQLRKFKSIGHFLNWLEKQPRRPALVLQEMFSINDSSNAYKLYLKLYYYKHLMDQISQQENNYPSQSQ